MTDEKKAAKKLMSHDIVLTCIKDKKKTEVSAQTFGLTNFKDTKVSGEKYYVDKAVKLGASKA